MTTATEVLEREHRTIERVLATMGRVVQQLDLHREIGDEILRDLLDFMRIFCDQFHNSRQESYLFPILEARGVPIDECPIAALKRGHVRIHRLVEELSGGVAAYLDDRQLGMEGLKQALQNISAFLPAHLWKEEYLLLPMAEKVLCSSDQQIVLEQLDLAEMDIGGQINCDFEKLADSLAIRIGVCPQCSHAA